MSISKVFDYDYRSVAIYQNDNTYMKVISVPVIRNNSIIIPNLDSRAILKEYSTIICKFNNITKIHIFIESEINDLLKRSKYNYDNLSFKFTNDNIFNHIMFLITNIVSNASGIDCPSLPTKRLKIIIHIGDVEDKYDYRFANDLRHTIYKEIINYLKDIISNCSDEEYLKDYIIDKLSITFICKEKDFIFKDNDNIYYVKNGLIISERVVK